MTDQLAVFEEAMGFPPSPEPPEYFFKQNSSGALSFIPKLMADAILERFRFFALSKKSEVFNEFKSDGKGKVKGYDDTLMKGKSSRRHSKLSKENFDEFYKKSSPAKSKDSKNVEKEAEEFEKYYKERGTQEPSSSKDKKENDKK